MDYTIHGPFEIPRDNGLTARQPAAKRIFWQRVEDSETGLSEACGCYILILRNVVWYAGLAARQSFRQECFTPHKVMLYDHALNTITANPQLLLLAKRTPQGRFARPATTPAKDIEFLEDLLIAYGIRRNDKILNIRGTLHLREMHVPGILNSTQGEGRAASVQALRTALGL